MVPMFDVFSGRFSEEDAVWIESAEGLPEAYQRMLRLAADKPGPYFVFSSYSHKSVVCIDTSTLLANSDEA